LKAASPVPPAGQDSLGSESQGQDPQGSKSQAPQCVGLESQAPESVGQDPQAPESLGPESQAPQSVGPESQAPQSLQVGRVGRAHGLDGSFYVTGARPRLLVLGMTVSLAGKTRTIVRRAGVDKRPIVRLEGIDDRTDVEALRGTPLIVPPQNAPTLPEGEWWAHELEGCTVLDGERRVGTVVGLLELPSCEALRVHREDGSELLVPMVSHAIRRLDVPGGCIDIDLGFLGEA
jgi:16S rRNA processing protein RimM